MARRGARSLLAALLMAFSLPAGAETVLAEEKGQKLTDAMVARAVSLGEFLAGTSFDAADRKRIADGAVEEFRKAPAEEIGEYKAIDTVLKEIAGLKTLAERARARAVLRGRLLSEKAEQGGRVPPLLAVVERHDPVLAGDPATSQAVTRRGSEALMASNDFVAGLVGQPKADAGSRGRFQQGLQAQFDRMSREQREVLVYAEDRWERVKAVWPKLSAEQKRSTVAELKKIATGPEQVGLAARRLEASTDEFAMAQHIGDRVRQMSNAFGGAGVADAIGNATRSFNAQ